MIPPLKDIWVKKGKGLAKEHICIPHSQVQECGEGQRRGLWEWVDVGKGGEEGDIEDSVNIKHFKLKNEKCTDVFLILTLYKEILH